MTDEQRRLLQAIVRRAEHCRRYAETCLNTDAESGHDVFVANVAEMGATSLMRTYFLLCGPVFRERMLEWILGKVQDDFGICQCGKQKEIHAHSVCNACQAEFDEQDREFDIQERMELDDVQGKPS